MSYLPQTLAKFSSLQLNKCLLQYHQKQDKIQFSRSGTHENINTFFLKKGIPCKAVGYKKNSKVVKWGITSKGPFYSSACVCQQWLIGCNSTNKLVFSRKGGGIGCKQNCLAREGTRSVKLGAHFWQASSYHPYRAIHQHIRSKAVGQLSWLTFL